MIQQKQHLGHEGGRGGEEPAQPAWRRLRAQQQQPKASASTYFVYPITDFAVKKGLWTVEGTKQEACSRGVGSREISRGAGVGHGSAYAPLAIGWAHLSPWPLYSRAKKSQPSSWRQAASSADTFSPAMGSCASRIMAGGHATGCTSQAGRRGRRRRGHTRGSASALAVHLSRCS